MKRPEDLEHLIDELRSEQIDSELQTLAATCAKVYMDPDDDDPSNFKLSGEECQLIFSSVSTVDRFLEAIGDTSDASLTLTELDMEPVPEVLTHLERYFATVDQL
jgi:hypothetical protein